MQDTAAHPPLQDDQRDYLEREMAQIEAIYARMLPDDRLNFVVYDGADPMWGAPNVTPGAFMLNAQQVGVGFLGVSERPGPSPQSRLSTVWMSIPRRPTPSESKQSDPVWRPARLPLRLLYRLSPVLYEEVRHAAEMRRKRRSARDFAWSALPRGAGEPSVFPKPEPAAEGQRPAVLIGVHWLEVGGAEKMALDTIHWALAAGLRVFVVASVPGLQRLSDRLPDHEDVTFIRLDRYLEHFRWPLYVERLVKDENIRLVHIHHCPPLYDTLSHLHATAPWVQVIDSTHIVEYRDGGYPRISGVWSNFVDVHHVISRELQSFFRDRFHLVHGVKLGRMLTRRAEEPVLPTLNFAAGQKTLHVAFVGRLYYQKRPVVVVETLRALDRWARRRGIRFSATLVGDGPFAPAVERLIGRYGLGDRVTQEPPQADVPALLKRSDILLLPSANEGLALVCYEAVEHGCIPISTDVGSQDEIVPRDLLVPVGPRAAVRGTVAVVDRLWRDAGFLAAQEKALHDNYRRLFADPTAEETLMPMYRAVARGERI